MGSILAQSEKDFVKGRCVKSRPYKRVSGSHLLKHTLHMLLPMGHQAVRTHLAVILDAKELATPSFSGRSHSGAHISASAMVCVGAARNPWIRPDGDEM